MGSMDEFRAEIVVDASPERVWSVITDTRALAEASPELVRMLPLLRGGFRTGQQFVGINRRGYAVWPTRNVVVAVVPGRRLVWDTRTSGARWIYELEPAAEGGTRLVERREVLKRMPLVARMFAPLLGGVEGHADELEEGVDATLARLKAIAER